jgi:hypothetical protein
MRGEALMGKSPQNDAIGRTSEPRSRAAPLLCPPPSPNLECLPALPRISNPREGREAPAGLEQSRPPRRARSHTDSTCLPSRAARLRARHDALGADRLEGRPGPRRPTQERSPLHATRSAVPSCGRFGSCGASIRSHRIYSSLSAAGR